MIVGAVRYHQLSTGGQSGDETSLTSMSIQTLFFSGACYPCIQPPRTVP